MTPRQLRLLRAAAASLTATLIAAVSHTVGGGAAPHPLLVAALSVFLLPLAALLIGGRARRHRVALTVLVSQAVFHLVFHALGSVSLTGPGGASVGGHSHHLALLGPAPAVATALPDAPMILAHAVAALLTTALLWHGERLLRTIAGWVRAALRPAPETFAARYARPAAPVDRRFPPVAAVRMGDVSRRGPPAVLDGARTVMHAV